MSFKVPYLASIPDTRYIEGTVGKMCKPRSSHDLEMPGGTKRFEVLVDVMANRKLVRMSGQKKPHGIVSLIRG